MSIKTIFKAGRAELKRKSRLRRTKRDLAEKERAYASKLTALGKRAWDSKLDISPYGELGGTLSQVEEKGKDINAKLDALNKQISELEEKKKSENARFDVLWKDLETKKKPLDSELKTEKGQMEKIQKEAEAIQKRLKNLPHDSEQIRKKMAESETQAQAKAELEKKLTALDAEQKQLEPKLPELTKIIQAAREKITPLELQVGRLEADMKKARDQHKKEIEDIDKILNKVKSESREFDKQQKVVSGQKAQNLMALGKKLSEAKAADPAVAAEMAAVQAAENEMASNRAALQSLDSQKAPGARGAVWKMAGLAFLIFLVLAAVILGIYILTKPKAAKEAEQGKTGTETTSVEKNLSQKSQGQTARTAESANLDLDQIANKLENIIPAFEEAAKEIARDSFDPQAVVDRIGKNPETLFQWVRDNTSFIAYQGILRGPVGVLMDRLGNSLDRSLLLIALLKLSGYKTRLVHAELSGNAARDLLMKARPVPNDLFRQNAGRQEESRLLERAAKKLNIDEAESRKEIDSYAKTDQDETNRALEIADSQTALILEALGHRRNQESSDLEDDARLARDHWWVQYEAGDAWLDLDPIFPDAKPGKSSFEPKETVDPDHCPEDVFHSVKIRILIDQWIERNLKEHLVLEQELRPSELIGQEIVLYQTPLDWPKNPDFSAQENPYLAWKTKALGGKEWRPILKVGPKAIRQWSFTDSGDINKSPGKKSPEAGGLAKGFFNALAGGGSQDKQETQSSLVAEWIEFEIRTPGQAVRTVRRQVFDLWGPDARAEGGLSSFKINEAQKLERALSLLETIDILPVVCQMTPQFIDEMMTRRLLSTAQLLKDQLKGDRSITVQRLHRDAWLSLESIQGPLYGWALLRREWSRHRENFYFDTMNIVNFRRRVIEDAEGAMRWRRLFDIIDHQVAVRRSDDIDHAAVRISQGVTDTIAERLSLSLPLVHENTSYLAELSKKQRVQWRAVRDSGERSLDAKIFSPDALARIKENLKAGYVVVMPERPITLKEIPRLGWWRIHPVYGETVGVMDTGFHQDTAERVIQDAYEEAHIMGLAPPPGAQPGWFWVEGGGGEGFSYFLKFFGLEADVSRGLYIRLVQALLAG